LPHREGRSDTTQKVRANYTVVVYWTMMTVQFSDINLAASVRPDNVLPPALSRKSTAQTGDNSSTSVATCVWRSTT